MAYTSGEKTNLGASAGDLNPKHYSLCERVAFLREVASRVSGGVSQFVGELVGDEGEACGPQSPEPYGKLSKATEDMDRIEHYLNQISRDIARLQGRI